MLCLRTWISVIRVSIFIRIIVIIIVIIVFNNNNNDDNDNDNDNNNDKSNNNIFPYLYHKLYYFLSYKLLTLNYLIKGTIYQFYEPR